MKKQMDGIVVLLCALFAITACTTTKQGVALTDYYTFALSENVTRTSVTYKNRYGITLAGDLYTAKDIDATKQYPAIIVGSPYGGIKEQGAGVYANQLSQRGFVVLTFDPPYNGESEGEPRHISSPELFAESFSAAVDFLGTQKLVDREKIGVIGMCGSGGFALSAAQMDSRIKAVATSVMYDISADKRFMSEQDFITARENSSLQRWTDFEKGEMEYIPSFPVKPATEVPQGMDEVSAEFFRYYGLKRGHHPHARANFTTTSRLSFFNFQLLNHIKTISPRPILFVVGENAHSNHYSETAYAAAAEPKELYRVPDAIHIDLYDDVTKIPFDKFENFFKQAFAMQ